VAQAVAAEEEAEEEELPSLASPAGVAEVLPSSAFPVEAEEEAEEEAEVAEEVLPSPASPAGAAEAPSSAPVA
jgi:hypothetical protein